MSVDHRAEALRWLSFAVGDLEAARSHRGRHVRRRIVAFEAQQCAEKAVKAALILEGIEPRRTHDLAELRGLDDIRRSLGEPRRERSCR